VRDTAERFAEYVAMVAEALSDEVGMWITLNEPWCSAWLGYGVGVHAPGRAGPDLAVRATHHLLLAHARGLEVLRRASKAPVGITLNLTPVVPASDHELDAAAAAKADGGQNRLFLDPLFKGRYPEDMVNLFSALGVDLDIVEDGDLESVSRPVDFLGVNYYFKAVIADAGRVEEARRAGYFVPPGQLAELASPLGMVQLQRPEAERTATQWEVEPGGLTEILVRLRDEYTPAPIYITENGAAEHDYRGPDGAVHDPARVDYLRRHIAAVHDAIEAGVEVKGYFIWSLLDNFEWSLGYSMRFGMVFVDYPSGERARKDSFYWYRKVIAANGLEPAS
ncbi:MAG: glycoside hydrolase family 1 protein, partial [Acidimicrobiales bacterium]